MVMLDKTKPLWLPEGSVRAVMGLTVIASTFGRALLGYEVPEAQLAVGTGVLLAYGAWRGAQAVMGRAA
jgi:hypothetical protein